MFRKATGVSKSRGENVEKKKSPPAWEIKSVWKKGKMFRKATGVSKSRGENKEKVKIPPVCEVRDVM